MDSCKDVIEDYKYSDGMLALNFYKYRKKADDEGVKQVIAAMIQQQCDKVRFINLNQCYNITDAALMIIGEHFQHLTSLHLQYCNEVMDEGITAVLSNNPKMKHLRFSNCKKVTVASMDAIIEYCPDIETLHAVGVGLTSLPDNIGNLHKMKTLYLGNNKMSTLPLSIGNLPEDCKLEFSDTPISNVPFATIKEGPTAIKRFFDSEEKIGAAKSNQPKMHSMLRPPPDVQKAKSSQVKTGPPDTRKADLYHVTHVLLSARFDGGEKERKAREAGDALRERGVNVYIVDAGAGQGFGARTMYGLTYMDVMIAFCFSNYGEKTKSKYCTYYELKYAYDNDISILPTKFCDEWPPSPPKDHDGKWEGREQNGFVFAKDLLYTDWSNRSWDAAKWAEETEKSLEKMGKCPRI